MNINQKINVIILTFLKNIDKKTRIGKKFKRISNKKNI